MKITIVNEQNGDTTGIEISNDFTLADLKAYIEAESGVNQTNMVLCHNNKQLQGSDSTLQNLGLADDDILVLRTQTQQAATITPPGAGLNDSVELYRQQILANPAMNSQIRNTYPQLHDAIDDPNRFREVFLRVMQSEVSGNHGRDEELRRLQENPDDPKNQERILEIIREQQIEENLQLAYDTSPESFTDVCHLYMKLKINGHETFALVDTGAKLTVIHPKLAEECGILNLVDKRFATMTAGVGTAYSEGRIHSVPVSLGDTGIDVPCSFTVLDIPVGILFGIDMLKRHKCTINLAKDVLDIGGLEIKFLNESEIEKYVKPYDSDARKSARDSLLSSLNKPLLVKPQANVAGSSTSVAKPTPSGRSSNSPGESAPTGTSASAEGSSAQTEEQTFPVESINQLLSLGFTRDEAAAALRSTNGNVELAASLLFN